MNLSWRDTQTVRSVQTTDSVSVCLSSLVCLSLCPSAYADVCTCVSEGVFGVHVTSSLDSIRLFLSWNCSFCEALLVWFLSRENKCLLSAMSRGRADSARDTHPTASFCTAAAKCEVGVSRSLSGFCCIRPVARSSQPPCVEPAGPVRVGAETPSSLSFPLWAWCRTGQV